MGTGPLSTGTTDRYCDGVHCPSCQADDTKVVDSRLAGHPDIAFNAGTHTDAVQMPYKEFERLAQPELLWLAHVM